MIDLPSSVTLDTGEGGLPRLTLDAPGGRAQLYLHGAHLTAWAPAGEEPVLWLSPTSHFSPDAAIRGGVPLCFPWFGALEGDATAPSHGFARLREWEVVAAQDTDEEVSVTLRLRDDESSRTSPWPHAFEAHYTVSVGRDLTLLLTVTNLDSVPVTFEEALHTYLDVRDVTATEVQGLEDAPYVDRLLGPTPQPAEDAPLTFSAETDRIYLPTDAGVTVLAPTRTITVDKTGSLATVVWNPWAARAAELTDMPDDAWPEMLCVETCNVRGAAVTALPGQSHTLTAVISTQA